MSDFPKWLLALAGINLIPLLICPLYLFGQIQFLPSDNGVLRFLSYCLLQLFWLLPIVAFFVSLDVWRRGFKGRCIFYALIGIAISVGGIWGFFL